jgi:hypothetical protein
VNVRIRCGGRPRTLTTRSTPPVGLVEEKAHFWRWAVPPSDGGPILEGASGSLRISVDYMASNLALAGSAYQEQWVSDRIACPHKSCGIFTSWVDPNPGFKSIPTVLGPMARTVEDIEIASRVVFGKSANYSSAPVQYREVKLGQKLKFGYYFNDGMARTTPACSRAVSETVDALRKQGHECVEFELPSRTLHMCLSSVSEASLCIPQPRKRSRCSWLSHQRLGTRNSSKIKVQIQRCGI